MAVDKAGMDHEYTHYRSPKRSLTLSALLRKQTSESDYIATACWTVRAKSPGGPGRSPVVSAAARAWFRKLAISRDRLAESCAVKIAYIITRADARGRRQHHVRDLARAMLERGHQVTVLVGGRGP